jgi:hypothetical protein
VSTTRYRIIFLGLGLALAVVVVFAVLLTPDSPAPPLPDPVERVSPTDGAIVQRQTSLLIDMRVGYAVALTVDGVVIQSEEIEFTEPTGIYRWAPGSSSTFAEWTPGVHAVEIDWRRISGIADPGSYRWTFRVQ